MEDHPEMKQWIKPERDPLLFNHHHYTHLQVDRVNSSKSGNSHHNVLLMGLGEQVSVYQKDTFLKET